MSVRCISQVLEKSRHAGTELLMLVVLADYSDDEGNSYPAVASLARKCRMSTRNARFILVALQRSGELRVIQNGGPNGCNRYRIVLSALGVGEPLKPASPLKRASALKPTSATPEAGFPLPLKPTSAEPSLNRQRTVNGHFGQFWPAYPRKVKKKEALKAFEKINPTPELLNQMLAALRLQVKALNWTGDRYTPHASTWLNGERWLDELPESATKSNRHPQWALDAGFANVDEAHNERCYERNAHEFRDGKRITGVQA
ncbi:MAG: hypothetical protein H6929_19980 [Rhodoferax sp.]|nr:hypothetical protein [Rhodoferax sp.]